MKYRIVNTEDGSFRIQTSLFGLFWHFYSGPTAFYSKYKNGFVKETKTTRSLLYNNKENAEETIKKIKDGNLIYKKFSIDLMFVYDLGKYECKYFVAKIFSDVYYNYFGTIEEAKSYVDKYWEEEENKKKKYKVKQVVGYY